MRTILESPIWDWLTMGSVIIGLIAALAFAVRYQWEVGFSWWRHRDGIANHFGRFLMIRKLLLSALFILILANRVFPGWTGREAVTAILMMAFALQTFVPYRLLVNAQRAQEKEAASHDLPQ
jgi:hypothetical protein